jgi:hypothetical protein
MQKRPAAVCLRLLVTWFSLDLLMHQSGGYIRPTSLAAATPLRYLLGCLGEISGAQMHQLVSTASQC